MKKFDTDKSMRRIQIAGYTSLALMFGVFGLWSATSNLNGAVIAHATLVSESYSKKIQHRDGGIVQKILVTDGDQVKAGQDIVLLDPTETKAELGIVSALLEESLVRRARLEATRDGKRELRLPPELEGHADNPALASIIRGQNNLLVSTLDAAQGKRNQFQQQISQLEEQMLGIDAQLGAKLKQSKLIESELTSLRTLRKEGLVPVSRVLATEREAASLAGEEGELRSNRASAQGRIGEVKIEMIQIDEQLRNQALTELRDTEAKIAEMQERKISATARLSRMSIKAPQDGTIYQLAIHTEGGVISPGEALMLLAPEGDSLVLQAQVQPQDVDNVTAGQLARIRFPGFNSRTTPEIEGKVTQVAADTTHVDAQTPPFYAVRLTITPEELKKLGLNKLRPGMNAEAFIQTEAHTPFNYLLRPFLDQWAYAMRET
jgi:HlyD family secretion protein